MNIANISQNALSVRPLLAATKDQIVGIANDQRIAHGCAHAANSLRTPSGSQADFFENHFFKRIRANHADILVVPGRASGNSLAAQA
jgi:hypothetical protein